MSAILVAGGCEHGMEQNALRTVEIGSLDVRDGQAFYSSRSIGSMTVARRAACSATNSSGAVIMVGGCSFPGVHESSAEVCVDGHDWKSSSITLLHGRSCCAQINTSNGRLVLFGGYDGVECLRSVELVEVEHSTVQTLKNLPCLLKNAAAIQVNDSRAVLVGGWDGERTLRTMFEYSVDDQSCSIIALLPTPIESHAIVRKDQYAFIVGGYDGISVTDSIMLVDLETFDTQLLSVRLAVARENHVCQIVQDKYLVVIGGWDGFRSLDSVEVFEIDSSPPFLFPLRTSGNLICPRNRPTACMVSP